MATAMPTETEIRRNQAIALLLSLDRRRARIMRRVKHAVKTVREGFWFRCGDRLVGRPPRTLSGRGDRADPGAPVAPERGRRGDALEEVCVLAGEPDVA